LAVDEQEAACVRIVIISDTHERHDELGVLRGDVLIHCGDGLNGFTRSAGALEQLDEWFGRQEFDRIFCTGGNHDFELEERVGSEEPGFRNADYLQDESRHYGGLTFYGAPWTPELQGWAFYLPHDELRDKWDLIPDDTDVLITHTPPLRILDQNRHGRHCGCPELQRRLMKLRPRIHCFGHIHASSGSLDVRGTRFVNASMVDSQYRLAREPYQIDFNK
jgi:Icc-related predicted phosphoesterase